MGYETDDPNESPGLTSPRFAGEAHLEAIYDRRELMWYGWYGCAVKKVQQALIDAGFPLPMWGVDGDYGDETYAAVYQFQSAHGLTADGTVGPKTIRVLQAAVDPYPSVPVDCDQPRIVVETGPGDGTLSVRVVMGEYAVDDASVMAQKSDDPTNRIGRTDSSGRYVFGELPAGQYSVSASKPGFLPGEVTAVLTADADHEAVIDLAREGVTSSPAVFGAVPLFARGYGGSTMTIPGEPLPSVQERVREMAERDANMRLGQAVDAEEQRIQSQHPSYNLKFDPENYTMECDEAEVQDTKMHTDGTVPIVSQSVVQYCYARVHLHYESEEQQ